MEPEHTNVTVRKGNSPKVTVGHATDRCRAVGSILGSGPIKGIPTRVVL